ncbi:MAG: DUF2798 domain-containing protein [Acetatifactor sp.]|nr:DUF2798 domain-containing protein [Acetatifactor sp.]
MPKNERESLIYTVMMCFFMITWMSVYNVSIRMGELSIHSIQSAWLGVPFAYIIGILADMLIASRIVKGFVFRYLVKPDSSDMKKIFWISTGMVIVMCILMSMYGAAEGCIHTRQWNVFFLNWVTVIPRNFIMAYPVQMLLAGPLIRKAFRFLFPEGTVQ